MDFSFLSQFVDANKLGGWVRAAVGALIAAGIAKYPGLGSIIDPTTQAEIGVAVSGLVVGLWSHYSKVLAAKAAPPPPPSAAGVKG